MSESTPLLSPTPTELQPQPLHPSTNKNPSPSPSPSPCDKMPPPSPPHPQNTRFISGAVLLLFVVFLWTISNFITSDLLEGGWDKPFLITYLNTSSFTFYLIPFLLKRWRGRKHDDEDSDDGGGIGAEGGGRGGGGRNRYQYLPVIQEESSQTTSTLQHIRSNSSSSSSSSSSSPPADIFSPLPSNPDSQPHLPPPPTSNTATGTGIRRSNSLIRSASPSPALLNTTTTTHNPNPAPSVFHPDRLSTPETAKLAASFCGLWFVANWSLNGALGWTSVGSGTVLAGMSGFFTLGVGRVFGVESFTRAKVLAVVASFFGLILVTHSDSLLASASTSPSLSISPEEPARHAKNYLFGDFLALLSALAYAFYVILLKVKIGDEERVDMQLFFGFVGLFNTVFLLPLIPLASALGLEPFELPTKTADWVIIGTNMLITLTSDYLYVLAMLKTTPVFVTIGLSLTIPFAMLGDFLRGSTAGLTIQAVVGATLVIAGFGLMGVEGYEENELGLAEVEDERGRQRSRSRSTEG